MVGQIFGKLFDASHRKKERKRYLNSLEPELQALVKEAKLNVDDEKTRKELAESQANLTVVKKRNALLQELGLKPLNGSEEAKNSPSPADECRDMTHFLLACGHRCAAESSVCNPTCMNGDLDAFRGERVYAKKNKGRPISDVYEDYTDMNLCDTSSQASHAFDRLELLGDDSDISSCRVCTLRRFQETFFYTLQQVSYEAELIVAQECEPFESVSQPDVRHMVEFLFRNPDGSTYGGTVPSQIWQLWTEDQWAYLNAIGSVINDPEYQDTVVPPSHEEIDLTILLTRPPKNRFGQRMSRVPDSLTYVGTVDPVKIPPEDQIIKEYFISPNDVARPRRREGLRVAFDVPKLPSKAKPQVWQYNEWMSHQGGALQQGPPRLLSPPPPSVVSSVASSPGPPTPARLVIPTLQPINSVGGMGFPRKWRLTPDMDLPPRPAYQHLQGMASFETFVQQSLDSPRNPTPRLPAILQPGKPAPPPATPSPPRANAYRAPSSPRPTPAPPTTTSRAPSRVPNPVSPSPDTFRERSHYIPEQYVPYHPSLGPVRTSLDRIRQEVDVKGEDRPPTQQPGHNKTGNHNIRRKQVPGQSQPSRQKRKQMQPPTTTSRQPEKPKKLVLLNPDPELVHEHEILNGPRSSDGKHAGIHVHATNTGAASTSTLVSNPDTSSQAASSPSSTSSPDDPWLSLSETESLLIKNHLATGRAFAASFAPPPPPPQQQQQQGSSSSTLAVSEGDSGASLAAGKSLGKGRGEGKEEVKVKAEAKEKEKDRREGGGNRRRKVQVEAMDSAEDLWLAAARDFALG